MDLFTVKPGYEQCAVSEGERLGFRGFGRYNGYLTALQTGISACRDLCFSTWHFQNGTQLPFKNKRCNSQDVAQWFCDTIREIRIEHPWPVVWLRFTENGFLPDIARASKVMECLKKRLSRIVRLGRTEYPEIEKSTDGLYVIETEDSLFCSREATFFGQRRMRNDPDAPSRSYLKVEEAFSVFGMAPKKGEIVVDLGAAPGGWSYAASKRGASVMAIDNGPLKKGAAESSSIQHFREDAFKWVPEGPVNWLFCDMVDEPSSILALIKKWLELKLFSYAIVNLKCGHTDPSDILAVVRGSTGIASQVKSCVCRHLYHDRNEFTMMLRV